MFFYCPSCQTSREPAQLRGTPRFLDDPRSASALASRGFHILGAGAIGCLWAARLSRAGSRVCLLLRSLPKGQAKSAAIQVTPPPTLAFLTLLSTTVRTQLGASAFVNPSTWGQVKEVFPGSTGDGWEAQVDLEASSDSACSSSEPIQSLLVRAKA